VKGYYVRPPGCGDRAIWVPDEIYESSKPFRVNIEKQINKRSFRDKFKILKQHYEGIRKMHLDPNY